MTVMANMGGRQEVRFDGVAKGWTHDVPPFHTLAVECVGGPEATVTAFTPGLPDDMFQHDGKMTKSEVRAVTVSKLMPMRGALLWDIGCVVGQWL